MVRISDFATDYTCQWKKLSAGGSILKMEMISLHHVPL